MSDNMSDSELIVMHVLWDRGSCSASEISEQLYKDKGWKKNTTYTLINRLIKKEAIERSVEGFICTPLVALEDTQYNETKKLLDKVYEGSFKLLVHNFIKKEKLTEEEIEEIRKMIEEE